MQKVFFNQCPKTLKIKYISFLEKKCSFQLFFRTSRSQFWKPCWTNIATSQKCFALNPKNFRLKSENDKNPIVFVQKKHGSPENVPLDTSKVVLTVIKEHFARWPKIFAPCLKEIKSNKVFKTAFFFPQSNPIDMQKTVVAMMPKKLCRKAETFFAVCKSD